MRNGLLVASAVGARLFAVDAGGRGCELVETFVNATAHLCRSAVESSSPGRFEHGCATTRSAMETRTDSVEIAPFALRVSRGLSQAVARNELRRLAIVATPRVLGAIKCALDPQTEKHVIGCLARNWSSLSIGELRRQVTEWFPELIPGAPSMNGSNSAAVGR